MDNKTNTATTSSSPPVALSAARAGAGVAAVFALIIAGFLIGNWIEMTFFFPRQEDRLLEMKQAVAADPADEQLTLQVRQMDQTLMQKRFRRLDFSKKGGYLLLGCVTVLLLSLKFAQYFEYRHPMPQPQPDQTAEQVRSAKRARFSVTVALLAAAVAWIVAIVWPLVQFEAPTLIETGPPTIEEVNANWATFRGPQGQGISPYTNIPIKWDAENGTNIAWETSLRGENGGPETLPGFNSPVIWENHIFFCGATRQQRQVYCFDLQTGQLRWARDVPMLAVIDEDWELMEDTGYAACTMATDGRRAYTIFPTGDIAAFDMEGNLVWNKNLGLPQSAYGYASSLAMYEDLVIIQFDQFEDDDGNPQSRMIALDGATGRMAWETPRPVRDSWSSPVVVKTADQFQLITCAEPSVIAYNPADGQMIWSAAELMGDMAPSPVIAGNKAYFIEVYNRIVAVKTDSTGKLTEEAFETIAEDDLPDITSPITDGKLLWMITTEGIVSCWDLTPESVSDPSERMLYDHEFEKESFYASPVLAGSKLYLLGNKGLMHILDTGREYKEQTQGKIDDMCYASPAVVDGTIVIRGINNLWCIKANP
ncbi:MAG: PQQ-binding-like beta-propeller repeat protein [Sedimentisphaerales bacterium]|nr:PQQ-binding-like beta-propeller repeat protein [Sedimentisphaerales bacterium]